MMKWLGTVAALCILIFAVTSSAHAAFVDLATPSPAIFSDGPASGRLDYAVFRRATSSESNLGDDIDLRVGEYAYLYQLVNIGDVDFNSVTIAFNDAPINNGGVVDAADPEIPDLLTRFQGRGIAASFSPPGDKARFTFDNLEPNQFTQVLFYRSFTSPTTGLVTIANDNDGGPSITRSAGVASVPLPPVFALILTGLPLVGLLRRRRGRRLEARG